jgi:hypothetical protein
MKKSVLILFICATAIANAQWIDNMSCNKNAKLIANQAIEYAVNLEYMSAFGAANSALLLDENCGCAKLVLAYISSPNAEWGSRAKKLKEINISKLTSEEKAWYDIMAASNDEKMTVQATLQNQFPNSPLIHYLATTPKDIATFKVFADKFPKQASSAYNMISYGYMNGAFGEKNAAEAMKYVKMSQEMHDGPNAYDSMGEHYASLGDYENALNIQLKAVDYGVFASPYGVNAKLYLAKNSKEEISKILIENQNSMQDAILKGDYESYKKFEHPEIIYTTGDSNLSPFYVYTKENVIKKTQITWDSFELSNMKAYFSPDMKTAVLNFEADGAYTMINSGTTIPYATRGSSTWVNTDDGWKVLHTSYAPRKGKIGIPGID